VKRIATRLLPGARLVFPVFTACLLAGAALAKHPDETDAHGRGPLPWRVGGKIGFTVDAAAMPDSSGSLLEVYVRLAPATLMAVVGERPQGGRFTLAVTLRNSFGRVEHKVDQEFVASGGDTAGGYGKVVILPFRTTPGKKKLQLKMTASRPGLSKNSVGRTQVESVEGELQVPGPEPGGTLSDLAFVWPESPGSRRTQREMLPNPERLYGLFADTLRAGFVARAPGAADRGWHWVARVLDSGGRVVTTVEGDAPPAPAIATAIAADLSSEPAGRYDLELKTWREGDAGALLRRARFSIAWEARTWTLSPQEIIDYAHFLLSQDDEEAFALMPPGEQERVISDFWRVRDPTPDTGVNEAREKFVQRVDFANRTYGRYGLGKGMFSDMGRVFIRYGEPSEVLRQVIPTQDNTLAEVVRQLAAADKRAVGDVQDKMMGADMRPFEVWIYEGEIPLPVDADPSTLTQPRIRNKRLVFLFVDEQWVGDYRLRYSTE
jgi:GWxTD domain-containing protein